MSETWRLPERNEPWPWTGARPGRRQARTGKNKNFNKLQLIENTQINKYSIPTSPMEEGSGKIIPSPAYILIKKFLLLFRGGCSSITSYKLQRLITESKRLKASNNWAQVKKSAADRKTSSMSLAMRELSYLLVGAVPDFDLQRWWSSDTRRREEVDVLVEADHLEKVQQMSWHILGHKPPEAPG